MRRGAGDGAAARPGGYDPFLRGRFPVGVRTIDALDTARDRLFPCEVWYPAAASERDADAEPGTYPLVAYSHHSGGDRMVATYLCTHLSSHGYVVAALDHSERVAPELRLEDDESSERTSARIAGWIANRVPDVRFLLDHLLGGGAPQPAVTLDPARVGIVGHSFGGWTALAAPAHDHRIRAVVALAPAGSSDPRPGIIPATLSFGWGRDVPTLYLVADQDTCLPLAGMYELFARTQATKHMVILSRADHSHFVDDVEGEHEAMRALPATGDLAWLSEMRPIAELCSPAHAHLFVRGLTLCHLDGTLGGNEQAQRFLHGDVEAELAERGVEASAHQP